MAVVVDNVSYSYADDPVLRRVSMRLDEGRTHIVLGPNGSGKTTLALAIAGVFEPDEGVVSVDGENPALKGFDRSKVQLAFQFPEEQMFESTVEAEIAFGLKNFGIDGPEREERSIWALGCVGLPASMLGRAPDQLSYGEMRKVALASVIALRPRYLLLDEPLAGLDWLSRKSVMESLKMLRLEGVTPIVLTHEPDLTAEFGDYVSLIVEGELRAGPVAVAEFFHSLDHIPEEYLPELVRVYRDLGLSSRDARPTREQHLIDRILPPH